MLNYWEMTPEEQLEKDKEQESIKVLLENFRGRNSITKVSEEEIFEDETKYDKQARNLKRKTNSNGMTPQEIVSYFRDKSIASGHKYIPSFEKDRGIISRIKKGGITSEEIVGIIDFIFSGDCNYINNPSINVLGSTWINTLYEDSLLWKKGEYKPRESGNKHKKLLKKRNHSGLNSEPKVTIKDW